MLGWEFDYDGIGGWLTDALNYPLWLYNPLIIIFDYFLIIFDYFLPLCFMSLLHDIILLLDYVPN